MDLNNSSITKGIFIAWTIIGVGYCSYTFITAKRAEDIRKETITAIEELCRKNITSIGEEIGIRIVFDNMETAEMEKGKFESLVYTHADTMLHTKVQFSCLTRVSLEGRLLSKCRKQ